MHALAARVAFIPEAQALLDMNRVASSSQLNCKGNMILDILMHCLPCNVERKAIPEQEHVGTSSLRSLAQRARAANLVWHVPNDETCHWQAVNALMSSVLKLHPLASPND